MAVIHLLERGESTPARPAAPDPRSSVRSRWRGVVVSPARVERATFWFVARRAIQVRHGLTYRTCVACRGGSLPHAQARARQARPGPVTPGGDTGLVASGSNAYNRAVPCLLAILAMPYALGAA